MKRFIHYLFVILLVFPLAVNAYAQKDCGIIGYVHTIMSGNVSISVPVTDFTATLYTESDTLSTVSKNGDFAFRDLERGTVTLVITKPGFATFKERIELVEGDQTVTIELIQGGEELASAVVQAERPIVTMKQDTLIFHATAVKRMAGDFAIDLIAQMPGAEVTEMGISVGGKFIQKAYVNGVLIFGRNPMDAMRNLAAEEVVTMNIYDETPEMEEESGSSKPRVVNIKTLHRIVDVTDTQVVLAGGADNAKDIEGNTQKRYEAGISGKFFSELLQIKTNVTTNNLGFNNFNFDGLILETPTGALTANSVNTIADLSVEKYWGRNINTRTGILVQYKYDESKTTTPTKSLTEYFQTGYSPMRNEADSSATVDNRKSHSLRTDLQKTIRGNKIVWTNNVSLSTRDQSVYRERTTETGGIMTKENSSNFSGTDSWNINETIRLTRSRFSSDISFKAQKDDSNGWLVDTLQSSSSRRYLTKDGEGVNWSTGINLTYFLSLKNVKHNERFQFNLSSQYTSSKKSQISLDLLSPVPTRDMVNTFDYTYNVMTNKAGFVFRRYYLDMGADFAVYSLSDDERIPQSDGLFTKSYFSILPNLMIYGKRTFSMTSTLSTPSVEQIRDRLDNINPFSIVAGNPKLRAAKIYSMSFGNAGAWNGNGYTILATINTNPITRSESFFTEKTVLDDYDGYLMPAYSTLYTYRNADWAADTRFSYHNRFDWRPIKALGHMNIHNEASTRLNINPSYMEDDLFRSKDWSLGDNLSMTSTLTEKFRLNLNASLQYSMSTSTISDRLIKAIQWSYGGFARYTPTERTIAEVTYANSSKFIFGTDNIRRNDFLKISIGASLMGQKLKILIEGIDLLDNKSSYSTSFSDIAFTQRFAPVFSKYYLLTIKYRFNSSQMSYFNGSLGRQL